MLCEAGVYVSTPVNLLATSRLLSGYKCPYVPKEVQNLIDWVCLSEQIKENNNTIHNLTGEYKKIEPDCREGVRAKLERMKELCKERNNLYEKQNDLKGQKQKIEKLLKR